MRSRPLGETLTLWEQLLAGAESNQEDLSALEQYRAQLASEIADVRNVLARRFALQAESFQATRDLRSFLERGSDLAERLQSGVLLHYGRRSPKLAEFGMKVPRPRLKRVKAGPSGKEKGCPLETTATAK
jgi:hypothetical protein